MEYNSQRDRLILPEYGRNIQKMVQFAMGIEEREKRNVVANAIIDVMGQLNPHLRDVEDFKHKLWTHLFLMSDFQLDVDSPYPKPEASSFVEPPKRLEYPTSEIKYGHYGRTLQLLIDKAITYEEGDEKDALVLTIGNLMKRSYLTWNRDSVSNEVIGYHLEELSGGKLKLKDPNKLLSTNDILKQSKKKKKTAPPTRSNGPRNKKSNRK